MPKIVDCQQMSEEWFEIRRGKPSASNFDKIITSTGTPSTQRKKYLYKLVAEKLGGQLEEGYTNYNMQRGIELESSARDMYSRDVKPVVQCGICLHEEGYLCSPDGLIDEDGMCQIKCPTSSVHIEYLINQKLPTDYVQQVQGELLVTGRKYNDFLSFYPNLKPLVVRCYRDEVFISRLRAELLKFISELNELTEKLR